MIISMRYVEVIILQMSQVIAVSLCLLCFFFFFFLKTTAFGLHFLFY